jgi:enoyl-CoA hydratase/carnithine racemase
MAGSEAVLSKPEAAPSPGEADDILVAVTDGIATVTLNRPQRRNAVTLSMWCRLSGLYRKFAEDGAVRAVILTGAGEHFCAGADITEFSTVRHTAEAGHEYDRIVDECSDSILHLPKPTIAAISGFCIGGGSGLALACDFRYAAPAASFGIPAARLSIVYGMRETQNLFALVGLANAKRLLFSADRFNAEEALRIGLIDRIAADPIQAARDFAALLSRNAPLSIAGAKLILNGLAQGPGAVDFAKAHDAIERAMLSEDYQEGQRAFIEKRAPRFEGR